jgi:hypothetical protein
MAFFNFLTQETWSKRHFKNVGENENRCQFHQHFMSTSLYESVICSFFCTGSLSLYFGQKKNGVQDVFKMLVKMATDANFTNISGTTFAPIFLHQKRTNLICKFKKAVCKTFVAKSRT